MSIFQRRSQLLKYHNSSNGYSDASPLDTTEMENHCYSASDDGDGKLHHQQNRASFGIGSSMTEISPTNHPCTPPGKKASFIHSMDSPHSFDVSWQCDTEESVVPSGIAMLQRCGSVANGQQHQNSSFHDLFSIHLLSYMIQEFLPIRDLKKLYDSFASCHHLQQSSNLLLEYQIPAKLTILKWLHIFEIHDQELQFLIPRSQSSRHLDRIHKMDLIKLKQMKQSRRIRHVAKVFFCLLCCGHLCRGGSVAARKPLRTLDNISLKLSLSEETQFFLSPLDLWADVSRVPLGEISIGTLLEIRQHLKFVISNKLKKESYVAHCLAMALKDLLDWCMQDVVRKYWVLDSDVRKYGKWMKDHQTKFDFGLLDDANIDSDS